MLKKLAGIHSVTSRRSYLKLSSRIAPLIRLSPDFRIAFILLGLLKQCPYRIITLNKIFCEKAHILDKYRGY